MGPNAIALLNDLAQTLRYHAAAIAQMASLDAQSASLKTELQVANRDLESSMQGETR